MLSYALFLFVATDGHQRKVTTAVFVGVLVNAIVDVLAVGFMNWGIKGAAWGSLAQFAINILMLTLYLRLPTCSYSLRWPGRKSFQLLVENIQEGAANSLMMFITCSIILTCSFRSMV